MPDDIRVTLLRFRHSSFAAPMKAHLTQRLVDARETNENEPATEENRMRVQALKEVIADIFGGAA